MPDPANAPAIEPPAPPSAAPDWDRQTEDLHCPLCEYNLRGLTNPVCPECGYRFEWAELLDADRRKHPYLFEHHPDRNYWSFRKTVIGGLRPGRFWTSLTPAMTCRPRRLVLYWGVTALAGLVVTLGLYATNWFQLSREVRVMSQFAMPGRGGPSVLMVIYYFPMTGAAVSLPATSPPPPPPPVNLNLFWKRADASYLVGWAVACSWPWLTLLALLVFRISMRRARIDPAHVLRCVVYSGDVVLGAGLILFALSAAVAGTAMGRHWSAYLFTVAVPRLVMACVPLIAMFRLAVAYQKYLRFDRPWATVLAAQAIVLLVWVNLLFVPLWLRQ